MVGASGRSLHDAVVMFKPVRPALPQAGAPILAPGSIPTLDGRRSVVPLAAVTGFVFAPLLSDLVPQRPEFLAVGVALSIVAVTLVVAEIREGRQRVARLLPAVLYIAAVAALRHSAGGAESGYSPLGLLAILWLSFVGTRRDLAVGIGLLALSMVAPILIVGPPDYPLDEGRRVLFTSLVGAFIGLTLQQLLMRLSEEAHHTRDQADALARQVEITTAILDTATDAIVSFEADGRVTAANAAAESILGRTAESLVGQVSLLDLVTPADRARLQAGLARWGGPGPSPATDRRFETEVVRPDRTLVPVEVSLATTNGPDAPAFMRSAATSRSDEPWNERIVSTSMTFADWLRPVTSRSRGRMDGRRSALPPSSCPGRTWPSTSK